MKESSNFIKLNSAEINVESATFSSGGASVSAIDIAACAEDETLTLTFTDNFPVGPAELCLSFTGILNDKLRGFYRSSYLGNFNFSYFYP